MKLKMADVAIPAEIATVTRNTNGGIIRIITIFYFHLELASLRHIIGTNTLLRLLKSEIGNSRAWSQMCELKIAEHSVT